MRWKHQRVLYQDETRAFLQAAIEQHEMHIFAVSSLDEAPSLSLEEKLLFLASGDGRRFRRCTRSVRRRIQRIREQEVARAIRWHRRKWNNGDYASVLEICGVEMEEE